MSFLTRVTVRESERRMRGIGNGSKPLYGTVLLLTFTCGPAALAGPYSTALGNASPGAIDPAVPGFTGPLGDGVSDPPNSVNPVFQGWATEVVSYLPAPGVDPAWTDPSRALGHVTGDNFDVVSLGDLSATQINGGAAPGQITLKFQAGIANRPGADLAVFENSLGSSNFSFAEFAYVEVSSDGVNFARLPSTSLTPALVGAYGSIDPTNVHNLAGKHINGFGNSWGTPFDLADLQDHPLVLNGAVNLQGIRYLRLIDIPGNGSFTDASGRPIFDAWQTIGSGGFDLEAVGVMNTWLGGDATLDGIIDSYDLAALAAHWQQPVGDFTQGDFDHSGFVDIADLSILAANWPISAGQLDTSFVVPEPQLLGVVLLAGMLLRKRNHQ